jgi:hypothetical protein
MRYVTAKRVIKAASILFILILALPLFADKYNDEIMQHRTEKDKYMKEDAKSPMPDKFKQEFKGLKYFPIDNKYRFEMKITEFDKKEPLVMLTSKGKKRDFINYGYFEIKIGDKTFRLYAYLSKNANYLFIPFRDKTSGKESYGGGRYLDLVLNKNGEYVVDFNLSYNPYCAYNYKYSCPIPPAENSLPAAIKAGERTY